MPLRRIGNVEIKLHALLLPTLDYKWLASRSSCLNSGQTSLYSVCRWQPVSTRWGGGDPAYTDGEAAAWRDRCRYKATGSTFRGSISFRVKIFFCPPKRSDRLWAYQPLIHLVPEFFHGGVKLTAHVHLVPWMNGAIQLLSPYAFMTWIRPVPVRWW